MKKIALIRTTQQQRAATLTNNDIDQGALEAELTKMKVIIIQNHEVIAALEKKKAGKSVKIKVETFNRTQQKLKSFLLQLDMYFTYNPLKTEAEQNIKATQFMTRAALAWAQIYLDSWYAHGSEQGTETLYRQQITIIQSKQKFNKEIQMNFRDINDQAIAR